MYSLKKKKIFIEMFLTIFQSLMGLRKSRCDVLNNTTHVVTSHIPKSIVRVLNVNWLLALANYFSGICLIAMGDAFYRVLNKALCLQFHDVFCFPFITISIRGGDQKRL
jgi:hypothetical protein